MHISLTPGHWPLLSGLLPLCSIPLPHEWCLGLPESFRVNSSTASTPCQRLRVTGRREHSPLSACLYTPPHSLFPLSSSKQPGTHDLTACRQPQPVHCCSDPQLCTQDLLSLKSIAGFLTPATLPCCSLERPHRLCLGYKRLGAFQ